MNGAEPDHYVHCAPIIVFVFEEFTDLDIAACLIKPLSGILQIVGRGLQCAQCAGIGILLFVGNGEGAEAGL